MSTNIKAWVLTVLTVLTIVAFLYDFAHHPEHFAWIVIASIIGAAIAGIHAVWRSYLRQR